MLNWSLLIAHRWPSIFGFIIIQFTLIIDFKNRLSLLLVHFFNPFLKLNLRYFFKSFDLAWMFRFGTSKNKNFEIKIFTLSHWYFSRVLWLVAVIFHEGGRAPSGQNKFENPTRNSPFRAKQKTEKIVIQMIIFILAFSTGNFSSSTILIFLFFPS